MKKGFTIIEVSIAGFIMVILGGAILGLQYIISTSQSGIFSKSLTVELSNSAIRTARQSDNGSYPIESASEFSTVFYSDIDFDGQTERVRYFLENGILKKGTTEPTIAPVSYPSASEVIKTIAENIQNDSTAIFSYYNQDWPSDSQNNPLVIPVDISEIRLIRIYIRLNPDPDSPETDYVTESYAQLRMLKDNL